MFGIVIAEAVALVSLIIAIYDLIGALEEKDEGIADLLKENNELRLKIGELMCWETVRSRSAGGQNDSHR